MSARKKQQGFTFRHPDGKLDWRIFGTIEAAQSNAAFALDLPSTGREFPKDWNAAYCKGFRVVPAKLVSTGRTKKSWREYQRSNP